MAYGVVVINENRRHAFDMYRVALVRIQFADLVQACFKQEVILYQSKSRDYPAGYFSVATLLDADVATISHKHLCLALSEPRPLSAPVPLLADGRFAERYIQNLKGGGINGRRAAEDFRHIPANEFNAIVASESFVRETLALDFPGLSETEQRIRTRVATESWQRSIQVRATALPPYDFKCAITEQKMLSLDGYRSGLQVCHVRPVTLGGPDICSNLFVCCPDFHSRYDQGTIDILDDYSWLPIGRHHDAVVANWHGPRKLFVPADPASRIAPEFLAAHREEILRRHGADCRVQSSNVRTVP